MLRNGSSTSTILSDEIAPLVFVGGPISAPDHVDVLRNIRRGLETEAKLWSLGFATTLVFSDFIITMFTPPGFSKATLQRLTWTLLAKSDYALMLPGWMKSIGSLKEVELANKLGIPIFTSIEDLVQAHKESMNEKAKDGRRRQNRKAQDCRNRIGTK
jgi:hypothetical protein